MLDEIIAVIDRKSKEEFTITKGLALMIVAASFVFGIILGSVCACSGERKKIRKAHENDYIDEEDFDAGEYVKSLNLDE